MSAQPGGLAPPSWGNPGFATELDLKSAQFLKTVVSAGADPGFRVGGGFDPTGGCQHTILPNFPKKLHEIEKKILP